MVERDYKRTYHLRKRVFGAVPLSEEEELVRIRGSRLAWPSRHLLYLSTVRWGNLRRKRLEFDHHACVVCGTKDGQLNVDHVRYVAFGEESMEDLRTLCRECHAQKTRKWDLRSGASGYEVKKRTRRLDAQLFDVGGWRKQDG